ncbi:DnaJ molecular chaperone homology domain [Rhizoctonia solani]|uniref:DnaJ molecular chaperone homology domain n=1 Tax=Rhizoctonia solani TaxID=456999 RepID=A0A8H7IIE1_9AGAM|nr:DnaJ molecular chaperone homology domain [Rhizoctonia solani]
MWVHYMLLAVAAAPAVLGGTRPGGKELRPLTRRGDVALAAGQFNDATRAYSEALELAPESYLLLYKRATAYMSQNQHSRAMADLDRVLEFTGDGFDKALFMKARLFAREGNWAEATKFANQYTVKNKGDNAAVDLLFAVTEGQVAHRNAEKAAKNKHWDICVEESTRALLTASHHSGLRELRANCALARLTHLMAPTSHMFVRIANLTYFLLAPTPQALTTVKKCLQLDPDSKLCRNAHRVYKRLDKEQSKLERFVDAQDWRNLAKLVIGNKGEGGLADSFDAALEEGTKHLHLPTSVVPKKHSLRRQRIYWAACKAYTSMELPAKAEIWCNEVLQMDPEDPDALEGKAAGLMAKEEWEEAVRTLEKAFEVTGRTSRTIAERLEKARRLLKQSRNKDYYKVLGVSRDADEKTIKKAYRKATLKAHPDKGGSEAKMAAVNEAYEVLSNPELRARFDNGDDPNDPTSGQGGHGFPGGFPGGFQFQQGGGMPFQNMFFGRGGARGGQQQFQFQWS